MNNDLPEKILLNKEDSERAHLLWKKRCFPFFKKDHTNYLKCLSEVICEKYNIKGYVSEPEIKSNSFYRIARPTAKFIKHEYHFVAKIPVINNIRLPKIEYKYVCRPIEEI